MGIITGLHYWFLMIFIQFAPLDTLQQGDIYKYQIDPGNGTIVVSVGNISVKSKTRSMYISSFYVNADRAKVTAQHAALLEKKNGKWYVKTYMGDAGAMNNKPILLKKNRSSILTDGNLSSQLKKYRMKNSYVLYRPFGKKPRKTLSMKVKVYSYKKNEKVVEVQNLRGLGPIMIRYSEGKNSNDYIYKLINQR